MQSFSEASALPSTPDPGLAFRDLADWIHDMARREQAPGLLVGLSGTDSILAFLACARALEDLGMGDRLMGIHYGQPYPPANKTAAGLEKILSFNPGYRSIPRVVLPWLQQQAPQARLVVNGDIDYTDDYQRWAALFKAALGDADPRAYLDGNGQYWVVGTRNATEQALGTYSVLSMGASVQPLINTYKSDVLNICTHLDVPAVALENSRKIDCECGRFDIAADHIDEIDAVLKVRAGRWPKTVLDRVMPAELREKIERFVDEQQRFAAFKTRIPYRPAP